MKPHASEYQLTKDSDFALLLDRLQLIRNDLQAVKTGRQLVTVVDFHVLYVSCNDGGSDFYSRCLKYGFETPLHKEGALLFLPGHLLEMERYIKITKSHVSKISADDVRRLTEDKAVQNWRNSMTAYLSKPDDILLFRSAIFCLNSAIGPNGQPKTRATFRKAARFLFVEKNQIVSFHRMLDILTGLRTISCEVLKHELSWKTLAYDEGVLNICIKQLSEFPRRSIRANIIDGLCIAICLMMKKELPSKSFRFFTSPAVVEAFFYNQSIPHNNPTIIRDPICMALERLVLESHKSIDDAISFLDQWIPLIPRTYDDHSISYAELISIRGQIRQLFRTNLYTAVNRTYPNSESYGIFELIEDGENSKVWRDQKVVSKVLNDMMAFQRDLSAIEGSAIEKDKEKKLREIDSIMKELLGYVADVQKVEEDYKTVLSELDRLRQKFRSVDALSALEEVLKSYFVDDAEEWEKNGDSLDLSSRLSELMGSVAKDKALTLVREFLQKSLEQKRLLFYAKVLRIIRLYGYDAF